MTLNYREQILEYDGVRAALAGSTSHLLLGNGFSVGCDPVFTYRSLYEAAVAAGLSAEAQAVFDYLGTGNFEGVLRLLDDAHYVAKTYRLIEGDESPMRVDVETVKHALVQAVAESHLAHSGDVSTEKKTAALRFIEPYTHIFTTNYDLLVYWVNMSGERGPKFGDGFRDDANDPGGPSLVFSEKIGGSPGILYLHGGLHLFTDRAGALRKHSWTRTGRHLMDLVLEALGRGQYPLFVAEGTAQKKLEQIQKNAYLSYAIGKLNRIERPLVIFGHALGDSDGHIIDAIASNEKIKAVYVGLHGAEDDPGRVATKAAAARLAHSWEEHARRFRRRYDLELCFFESASARCWGN